MKIAYFECIGGISGDMILGALVGAGVELARLETALKNLSPDGFDIQAKNVFRNGIGAVKVDVTAREPDISRTLSDIVEIISSSRLPDDAKARALRVFEEIAKAEASAHGVPLKKAHFHEVGALDAIVDIVGTVLGLSILGIEEAFCSSLPVSDPAPATLELLKGMSALGSTAHIETVTPTGAAIAKVLTRQLPALPPMTIEGIGAGAGTADTTVPNIVRLYVGEAAVARDDARDYKDSVQLVETNIDHIAPEVVGFTVDALMAAGALDAWCTPVFMKKNRPGVLLSFICDKDTLGSLCELVFRECGTLGLRISERKRKVLDRRVVDVETEYGVIPVKTGVSGGAVVSAHPEYEACKRKALEYSVPLRSVMQAAADAYAGNDSGDKP